MTDKTMTCRYAEELSTPSEAVVELQICPGGSRYEIYFRGHHPFQTRKQRARCFARRLHGRRPASVADGIRLIVEVWRTFEPAGHAPLSMALCMIELVVGAE